MNQAHLGLFRIEQPRGATLSKGQKQFNTLIKKVELLRHQLAEWQSAMERYHHRVGNEYDAQLAAYNSHRLELLRLLDSVYPHKIFKPREREKMRHLICEMAKVLMTEEVTEELKSLHDKYSEMGYDEKNQQAGEFVKMLMEQTFGVDLSDVDVSSPEQMHAFMEDKMREEQALRDQARQQAEAQRVKRKKTPKQIQKEAEQKAAAQDVRKSLQEIFRKLAASLHPDREQDESERERKTALMQRVNVAYGKKDLLGLLGLQLEIEQIEASSVNALSEHRLKHYNHILKEQAAELQEEMDQLLLPLRMGADWAPWTASPKSVLAQLDADIRAMKRNIVSIKDDLQSFQDPARLKAWLKDYRIPKETAWG